MSLIACIVCSLCTFSWLSDGCNVLAIEYAHSLSEPYVMVIFQGNVYVSAKCVNYLITPSYENMTLQGIVSHTKAYNKPLREAPSTSREPMRKEGRSEAYAPSAPPLPLE